MALMASKAMMILSTGRSVRNNVRVRAPAPNLLNSRLSPAKRSGFTPNILPGTKACSKRSGFTPNILPGTKACSKRSGFTLIEVTLVSVIILILITLSMPLFRRTYEDLKITSCTKDISQIIHFSRQRAIFERRNYRFVIDSDNNSYQILVQDEESDKFIPLADRWGRVYNVAKDIEIRTDKKQIDFSPSGVSDSAIIYIIRENKTYSIILDGSTGSIKINDKTE